MASEIRTFTPSIPAATLATAPVTVDLSFPSRVVEFIEITMPPGLNGLVGFRLASNGAQIIPAVNGTWFIGSGQIKRWDLTNQITTGAWQLLAYNTGRYAHMLLIDFGLNYLQAAVPASITPIPIASLNTIQEADTIAGSLPELT